MRAVLGPLAFAVALALGSTVAAAIRLADPSASGAATVAVAVITGVVTVGLITLLCRRARHRSLVDIGVRRPASAVLGVGVVAASAAVVFGVDALAGGIRVLSVDPATLALFLLTNTALALALEAVPEEFALRGYAYSALAQRWRPWLAGLGTTALFVVTPAAAIAIAAGLGAVLGVPTPPATFAPGGQDPVSYAVLLAVFGAMLAVLRVVTGSVWACVGAHLMFLTVNRALLGFTASDTGVRVALPPGGELLVLVYLVLATVGLGVVATVRTRRRARNQVLSPAASEAAAGPR